jgi:uncharacterized Zn finger protein
MTENMTVCPECGTEFDTIDEAVRDDVIQTLRQQCPDCGYEVDVGIINYPDRTFEVIAPAIDGDEVCGARVPADRPYATETCEADPDYRIDAVGTTVELRCTEHAGVHREKSRELLD